MHPEIEKLMNIALQDGVITDKEREILLKKCEQYGMDKDEFEMILEGELSKIAQKQKNVKKESDVVKCPNCKAVIPALSYVCEFCGFVINSNQQRNSNTNEISLSDSISKLENFIIDIKSYPMPSVGKYVQIAFFAYMTVGLYLLFRRKPKESFENLVAKCQKESRYILTYYGNNDKIKLLVKDLENDIQKVKKERVKTSIIAAFGTLIVAVAIVAGLYLFREFNLHRNSSESKIDNEIIIQIDKEIQEKNYDKANTLILKLNDDKNVILKKSQIQLDQLKQKIDDVTSLIKAKKFEDAKLALSQIIWTRLSTQYYEKEIEENIYKTFVEYKNAMNKSLPEKYRIESDSLGFK